MVSTEGSFLCPICQGKTMVKDSRPNDNGTHIRRRRWCFAHGHRFTTYEVVIDELLTAQAVGNLVGTCQLALRGVESGLARALAMLDAVEKAKNLLDGKNPR